MMLARMYRRWRAARQCFHHDHHAGKSWIEQAIIDCGRRKMYWCSKCGHSWIL